MHFEPAERDLLDTLLSVRAGETRIGQRIQLPTSSTIGTALDESDAAFVLLGIPEDFGVRANLGIGGAHTAWIPALRAFLNTQSNRFVDGAEILLLGRFDFTTELEASQEHDTLALRDTVSAVDAVVAPVIEAIVRSGKIPLVVGGGHNNAFPILKGVSLGLGNALNCINLDAHSDYRRPEGRHSGNGFRYARADGHLARYALPWLHEAYNSAGIVAELETDPEIFIRFAESGAPLDEAINAAINFTAGAPTGIELDLDCIEGVLSSAATPSGITPGQARQFLRDCGRHCNAAYLHLTEGATELRDGRTAPLTAKLISYLLRDFIAARKARGISS